MLAGADAFLAVGPIETFGLAALEALASGTPVICRESAAISEVIDDQCGLALPRNASTWATAIDNIFKKDRETLRQASRSRAENFSWTNSVERLVELHEGIGVA
jgi:alpha-1,6-mannosyltransferase